MLMNQWPSCHYLVYPWQHTKLHIVSRKTLLLWMWKFDIHFVNDIFCSQALAQTFVVNSKLLLICRPILGEKRCNNSTPPTTPVRKSQESTVWWLIINFALTDSNAIIKQFIYHSFCLFTHFNWSFVNFIHFGNVLGLRYCTKGSGYLVFRYSRYPHVGTSWDSRDT